jgi:6-phosphogluconate dehydrogenase
MKLGYIGLGKMGFNMVERLLEKGHAVVVYDTNNEAVTNISKSGAQAAVSLPAFIEALLPPRLVWLMVPYQAVESVLNELVPLLQQGDTVIDGGNSPYKESMSRSVELEKRGIDFLDVGVSGGPGGARNGACLMVGGKKNLFEKFESLFRSLSADRGYGYMGKAGSGHFVKMVHNGIEYGMMQAIAEGFTVMKASPFDLNMIQVAEVYNHASVIESRLVGWLKNAFEEYGEELREIAGSVSQSGEGLWTVEAGKELGIPVPIIEGALNFRMQSQNRPSYTGQIVSALRNQFGGHEVLKKGQVKKNG